MKKTILIARHGETDFNREEKYQGWSDTKLNKTGLKQARALAKKLARGKIEVIISSPLLRCRQTAEVIAERIGVEAVFMEEFKERGLGVYEGLTRKEAKTHYPKLWGQNITRLYEGNLPGGEDIKTLEERVKKGLEKVRRKYKTKKVLLVTHGMASKAIRKILGGYGRDEDLFSWNLGNGEVVELAF